MIKHLKILNVGPSSNMELEFGKRLNLLTGDNGLGKSFLLDIIWWALTRRWPAEVNPRLTEGKKALPPPEKQAQISFSFSSKSRKLTYTSQFERKTQSWTGKQGRPANPGLVLYAMSDGSFAVWDPSRNYWISRNGMDVQERVPAYVFSPNEVWNGLQDANGNWLCNGLIRDWASWYKESAEPFEYLKQILEVLSPSMKERLTPGKLVRIGLDDIRDIPTIRMPYHQDVAVVHASSGMRRIIALAYFLVWSWEEHKQAARQLGEETTNQITFLVDEVESHLHPSWQRSIIPAILSVMEKLTKNTETQLIATTHSPLVMTSVEPLFDVKKDAWFDLDLKGEEVVLRSMEFEKHGDISNWLVSDAFDLKSGRAIEYECLINEAASLLNENRPDKKEVLKMYHKLKQALDQKDNFLFRWRLICEKKGLLE